MGQFSKVLLAVDNAQTVTERALDCGTGLGWLKQVVGPTVLLPLFRPYPLNARMYHIITN